MRILGVDPGLRVTGYGVIQIAPPFSAPVARLRHGARGVLRARGPFDRDGIGFRAIGPGAPKAELVEAGVIRTRQSAGIAARLQHVHDALSSVIAEHRPDVIAIEKLYAHYEHPTTAILMGHVRGVVCLLSGTERIPIASMASTHVKKAITGRGHAGKEQIGRMVQAYLGIKAPSAPSDATDALAIALSFAFNRRVC